jgi:Holliday junction resolvase
MGKASREKGKRGEREWARFCRDQGYDCKRTAQYRGNTGDAGDVEGLPHIHIEVKRTEVLRAWDYMTQAIHDAGEAGKDQLPIVAWKKNDHPWMVMMRAEDWFKLYREWEAGRGQQTD